MRCLGKCLVGLLLTAIQSFAVAGTVGGGGGFSLATELIDSIKVELSNQLLDLDDADIAKLVGLYASRVQVNPEKYISVTQVNKQYLSDLIKNAQHQKNKEVGDRVVFWEGNPKEGFHLEFLKPFYSQYGQLNFAQTSDLIKRELKRKLIHEASHTWGLGDLENGADDKNSFQFSDDFMTFVLNNAVPVNTESEVQPILSDDVSYSNVDICVRKKWQGKTAVFDSVNCRGLELIALTGEEIFNKQEDQADHQRMTAVCQVLGFEKGHLISSREIRFEEKKLVGYAPLNRELVPMTKHTYTHSQRSWSDFGNRYAKDYFGRWVTAFECSRR